MSRATALAALLPLIYGPEYVAGELQAPPSVSPAGLPDPGPAADDQAATFLEGFWSWLAGVEGVEAMTAMTMEPLGVDEWTLTVDLAQGAEWYATHDARLIVDQWFEVTSRSTVEHDATTGDVAVDARACLVSGLIINGAGDTRAVSGIATSLSGVSLDEPARAAGVMFFVPGSFHPDLVDASAMVLDVVTALHPPENGDVNEPCVDGPGGVASCRCQCGVAFELAARACALRFIADLEVCLVLAVGVFFFCWIPCSGAALPAFQPCMVACIKTGLKIVAATCIVSATRSLVGCMNAARINYRFCLSRC